MRQDGEILNTKNHLFFKKDNLEVIPTEEKKQAKIKELYENIVTGIGCGFRLFYHNVTQKYLNIKRKDVDKKVFQMTRPANHLINKPVIATRLAERFSIDLVEIIPQNQRI
jgi:hypothetical protein